MQVFHFKFQTVDPVDLSDLAFKKYYTKILVKNLMKMVCKKILTLELKVLNR